VQNIFPEKRKISACRAQTGIVAIDTIPAAALTKDGCSEFAGPVAGGKTG